MCVLKRSVMFNSLRPYGLWRVRFLCPGEFLARILVWVAITSSRGSPRPRDWICVVHVSCIAGGFFTAEPPGKPQAGSGSVQKRLVKRTAGFLLSEGEMGQDRLDPEAESGPGTRKEWRTYVAESAHRPVPGTCWLLKGTKIKSKSSFSPKHAENPGVGSIYIAPQADQIQNINGFVFCVLPSPPLVPPGAPQPETVSKTQTLILVKIANGDLLCDSGNSDRGSVTDWRVGWGGRWEGGLRGRGHGCTCSWFLLMCDRKPQNSVNQSSFN